MTEIEAGPSFPSFIILNLHPDKPGDWAHIQRSVDGTTAGIDHEARVPGTQERYFDRVAPTQGGYYYRTRGIGPTTCTDPSDWTAWRQARGVVQPGPTGSKTPVGKEVPREPGGANVRDVVRRVLDSGHLNSDARQNTGGEIRQLARGVLTGQHPDEGSTNVSSSEATVDFTEAVPGGFSEVPTVIIMPGGRTQVGGSTVDRFMVEKANGLNELGFTMQAYLQDPGTTTAEDDAFPAGTLVQDGDALSLAGQTEGQNGGVGLSATDKDSTYTVRVSGSVTADSAGSFVSAQVTIQVQTWDNDAGSPSWQDETSATRSANADNGNQNTNNFNENLEFTNSAIGSGDDVRVIISVTVVGDDAGNSGASVDPNDCQYTSSTGPADTTMSPNAETVRWWAIEGV